MSRAGAGGKPEPEDRRLILGLHPVREAVRVRGGALFEVLIGTGSGPLPEKLARFATDQGVTSVRRVPRALLDRLAHGVAHQDVAAWAPPLKLLSLEEVLSVEPFLGVALDSVQDPQNFGAVIRSAVGLARAAVIWGEHASAPLGPATFRASAGAVEHARLARVQSLSRALGEARERGITVVGLDPAAPAALSDVDLTAPSLIVLGSEHRGLKGAVRAECDQLCCLSRTLGVDSLNASVAAAIALYEANQQRTRHRA